MSTCKNTRCGERIEFMNTGDRWIPINPDGSRHRCRKSRPKMQQLLLPLKVASKPGPG